MHHFHTHTHDERTSDDTDITSVNSKPHTHNDMGIVLTLAEYAFPPPFVVKLDVHK